MPFCAKRRHTVLDGDHLDIAVAYRNGALQRLGVDHHLALVPLLARTLVFEFRERDAQCLVHVDPVAEQVGADALDDARHLERLPVHTHTHDLLGGIGIAQFGDIPQNERRDEQRKKDRRDVAVHPFQQIIHCALKFHDAKVKIKWTATNRAVHFIRIDIRCITPPCRIWRVWTSGRRRSGWR